MRSEDLKESMFDVCMASVLVVLIVTVGIGHNISEKEKTRRMELKCSETVQQKTSSLPKTRTK